MSAKNSLIHKNWMSSANPMIATGWLYNRPNIMMAAKTMAEPNRVKNTGQFIQENVQFL